MNLLRTRASVAFSVLRHHAETSQPRFLVFSTACCRSYATHRSPTSSSSLLSQTLDSKQRSALRNDSVGPFQLGMTPPSAEEVGDYKKWSELSTGGKVLRTTARTSNLVVILFGAGLSAVLIYALTSELFSKNSPTVLYGQACELIKSSPMVSRYLQGPLIFHNNPPSSLRPRHRNHQVTSQIALDSSGKEHLLLNFYVEGRRPGSPVAVESDSYFDSALEWTKDTASMLSEMSLDEMVQATKDRANEILESWKRRFKFLSGDMTPSPQPPPMPIQEAKEQKKGGWTTGFTGLFAGLRGPRSDSGGSSGLDLDGPFEGEVHADLVMNEKGYFEFRYLLIDIPDTHAWNAKRVFVVRSDGVREAEQVMRWRR